MVCTFQPSVVFRLVATLTLFSLSFITLAHSHVIHLVPLLFTRQLGGMQRCCRGGVGGGRMSPKIRAGMLPTTVACRGGLGCNEMGIVAMTYNQPYQFAATFLTAVASAVHIDMLSRMARIPLKPLYGSPMM